MRATGFIAIVLSAGCGTSSAPIDASIAAPSSHDAIEAGALVAPPSSLVRTVTPRARKEKDERACEANDAASCRAAAGRYRGYGHVAGCGVDRSRPKPYRSVTAADAAGDAKLFDKWIRRACDLGDEDACLQGRNNIASSHISGHDMDVCARGGMSDCALFQWQSGMHPDNAKALEHKRGIYMKTGATAGIFGDIYRREKTRGGDELPKEVFDLADRICKASLECDDVMMMLDKNGYPPAALPPLRKSAGEALVSACLAGDCVCGEAAAYLDASDPRRADLARIGCDDGEPDACFLLGLDAEAKHSKNVVALYEVACPSLVASDEREEVYSRAACDKLSQLYEEGGVFERDSDRAFFYSSLACTRSGFERDHAFCLRRALFHARGYRGDFQFSTQTNVSVAHDFFYGIDGPPVDAKECERPSVQALCKRDEHFILTAKVQ